MLFKGTEYKRDRKGFYRCPYPDCHHPDYPARKFKTDVGFIKHMEECKGKPGSAEEWVRPTEPPRRVFGACVDCGNTIYEMDTIWYMYDRLVCIDCHLPYLEEGRGHVDFAGLDLGVALEG